MKWEAASRRDFIFFVFPKSFEKGGARRWRRLRRLIAGSVGVGDLHVFCGPVFDVRLFFWGEGALNLRGSAENKAPGRDAGVGRDEGSRGDDGMVTDDGSVHYGGAHTDEAFVFDNAGVNDRGVAYCNISSNTRRVLVGEVDNCAVLDVRAIADFYEVDVSAEDAARPNASMFAEANVAQ